MRSSLALVLFVLVLGGQSVTGQTPVDNHQLPAIDPIEQYCVVTNQVSCKDLYQIVQTSYCEGNCVYGDENAPDPEMAWKCPGPQEEVRARPDYLDKQNRTEFADEGAPGQFHQLKKINCIAKMPCKCHYDYLLETMKCVLDTQAGWTRTHEMYVSQPITATSPANEGGPCTGTGNPGTGGGSGASGNN
ncbi:MAG: hypothetical protein U0930_01170 [Pirellulales bacterium]